MSELVLHHFDWSPYAEKVRVLLGIKGLAWRSVQIPMVMPKPDLTALTGGYRKTPVLQVGADIYCDSSLIALRARATASRTDTVSRRWSGPGVGAVRLGRPVLRRRRRAVDGPQRRAARRPDAGPARILLAHGLRRLSRPRAAPVRPGARAREPGREPAGRRARLPARIDGPGLPTPPRTTCSGWRAASSARWATCCSRSPASRAGRSGCVRSATARAPNSTPLTRWRSRASRTPLPPRGVDAADPSVLRQGRRVTVTPDDYGKVPVTGELVTLDCQTRSPCAASTRGPAKSSCIFRASAIASSVAHDRPAFLSVAERTQDPDDARGVRAAVPHRRGEHPARRAVRARLPAHQPQQPHSGDRRHDGGGRSAVDLRVGRDPAVPRREIRAVAAARSARPLRRAAVAVLAGGGPRADGGPGASFPRVCAEVVPYGIKRYTDEVNRLYGVLDRRLADRDVHRRRVLDRRHRLLAVDRAARTAGPVARRLPARAALVRSRCASGRRCGARTRKATSAWPTPRPTSSCTARRRRVSTNRSRERQP